MPAEYCQHGLRVIYPENWELTEPEIEDSERPCIALETPDGSLLLIQLAMESDSGESLLDEMTAGLNSQYDDVEFSGCQRQLGPVTADGLDALFFCLDAVIQARLLVFDCGGHRIAALYQADSRRMPDLERVFDAVLAGIAMSSAGAGPGRS